jgi:hypothetical protein
MTTDPTRPARAATLGGWALPEPAATELAVRNLRITKDAGWKVLHGWGRKGPLMTHDGFGYAPEGSSIVDHPYRLRCPGRTVYVSEPYGLSGDCWQTLADLEVAGWRVSIGQLPLYYPGSTVAIHFERVLRAEGKRL